MELQQNLSLVHEKIQRAAESAGKNAQNITLVAVSKTVDVDKIQQAIDLGVTDLGENRPQELKRKSEAIAASVNWHQIGQLQTNKVKYVVDRAVLIHSLDRVGLAEEIERQCVKKNIVASCLIQVNIGREPNKSGIMMETMDDFLKELSAFPHVKVKGLMTVPPIMENSQKQREYFRQMHQEFERLKQWEDKNVRMEYLSMGMSDDYVEAILEGANMVRVGSAIFGARNYHI